MISTEDSSTRRSVHELIVFLKLIVSLSGLEIALVLALLARKQTEIEEHDLSKSEFIPRRARRR